MLQETFVNLLSGVKIFIGLAPAVTMLLLRVGVARPRLWFEDVILSVFMLKLFQKVALKYYSKLQFFLIRQICWCKVQLTVEQKQQQQLISSIILSKGYFYNDCFTSNLNFLVEKLARKSRTHLYNEDRMKLDSPKIFHF